MSGPEGSEPTETPWWQQVRRQTPPTPGHSADPQGPPSQQPVYQRPAYQSAQQPAPQPGQQSHYYPQYAQQYPQYAQQPGPYGYPGQYGAQPADAAGAPNQSKRWLLITGGVLLGVIVALALVLGLLGSGVFNRHVLDVNKAQEAVKRVITDPTAGYGIDNVTDVNCNNGKNPSAKKGETFTCQVTVDGKKRHVTAVFIDDNGTYEVDRPR
jgi:uncharacterized protein DUF4333